jgi:hypothetical protein
MHGTRSAKGAAFDHGLSYQGFSSRGSQAVQLLKRTQVAAGKPSPSVSFNIQSLPSRVTPPSAFARGLEVVLIRVLKIVQLRALPTSYSSDHSLFGHSTTRISWTHSLAPSATRSLPLSRNFCSQAGGAAAPRHCTRYMLHPTCSFAVQTRHD